MQCLFAAHYTIHFLVIVVNCAGKAGTVCFDVIEERSLVVVLVFRQGLLVCIHTCIHGARVVEIFGHEVAIVLSGPG